MEDIVLIGYGGHAKSVADCIERSQEYKIIGYTDLKPSVSKYVYLGTDEELESLYKKGIHNAAIGIGYLGKGDLREKLFEKLKKIGYILPVILDTSSIVSDTASIGEGTFIGKAAIINAEAQIGKAAIINTKALIEHECVVEDFAHVAVAAILCGQVKVGRAAFVGANATIIQGGTVFPKQIVPAGVTIRECQRKSG